MIFNAQSTTEVMSRRTHSGWGFFSTTTSPNVKHRTYKAPLKSARFWSTKFKRTLKNNRQSVKTYLSLKYKRLEDSLEEHSGTKPSKNVHKK